MKAIKIPESYNTDSLLLTTLVAVLILAFPLLNSSIIAQDQSRNDLQINLNSRKFTPQAGIKSEFRSSLQTKITVEKNVPHIMIQFTGLPSPIDKELLKEKGIKVLTYLGSNTWYASISDAGSLSFSDTGVISKDPVLGSIRWMGDIAPEDKIAPLIKEKKIGKWARSQDGKVNLVITYFTDLDTGYVKSKLESLGAKVLGGVPVVNNMTIIIGEEKIADLAAQDFISWIEPVSPRGVPESDRVRTHVQANLAQNTPLNLTGTGVKVGIFEWNHFWVDHADFSGRAWRKDATANEPGQHTTMVAGIIGGDGLQSSNNGAAVRQWKGMAPGANLFSYNAHSGGTAAQDYLDFTGDLQTAIGTDHIDIANNSWGASGCTDFHYGVYEGICSSLDAAVRGDYGKPVSIVFSAGNDRDGFWDGTSNSFSCLTNTTAPFANYGNINYPKASKNSISVGAIDSYNNMMTGYSSWGPLADGRIKPEIVASGHHNGTQSSGITIIDNAFGSPTGNANQQDYRTPNFTTPSSTWVYAWMSQTSCAAAATSGCLALLLENYRNTLHTTIDPLPSTMKALIIHSAKDLDDNTTWYNPGPDYASGYGLLQIKDATDLVKSSLFREGKVTTNKPDHYTFTVPAGAGSVKVTLVWDDPQAASNAAVALVNDLDLKVYDPNNVQYFPWTLNPAIPSDPAVRTAADHLNNVEQVFVNQNLVPGTWKVVVDPYALPQPPQRYSLVTNYKLAGQVDIIQVLDRSGSMSGKASASMPDSKIKKLADAASQFIDIMKPNIGNRLGLVQFNQDVVPFPANSGTELSALDGTKANLLKSTTIPAIIPGGTTSIGDGLNEALTMFLNATPEPEHDRSILLVTDGMENTPLWISDVQPNLIANDVTVHALGLGYGSGIDEAKLAQLVNATNGTYRITSDNLIFQKLFIETLAGAVDWSVINDPVGNISRGDVVKVPVVIASDQDGVTFTVYWEGSDNAVTVELITPSGRILSNAAGYSNIRYGKGSRYVFYQIDFPLLGDLAGDWAGEWQIKLVGTNQIEGNGGIRYSTSAFAENGPKLNVVLSKLYNLTGNEIQIKAALLRGGKPVTGAKIDVFGDVPLTGVGNVLHDGIVNMDQLRQPVVVNGDTLNKINQKLKILSGDFKKGILQRGPSNFILYDDGLHGDGAANDGIYANKFGETKIQGSYTFRFVASGIRSGGKLQSTCEWTKSFYNEVNIVPDHSDITFRQSNTTSFGVNYGITITPKDGFGNYLGPGHKVTAKVIPGTSAATQLTDNIDGSYSNEVNLSPVALSKGAKVMISIDDKEFTSLTPKQRKWSVSLHAGAGIPTGSVANDFKTGLNVMADAGYHFNKRLSLVALIGYSDFKSKRTGIDDDYFISLNADVRYIQPVKETFSVYVGCGPGLYMDKAGDAEFGANIGVGMDYDVSKLITLELGGNYHLVFGKEFQFINVHAGVVFNF